MPNRKTPKPNEDVHSPLSQMIGQSLEAEEQMAPPQPRLQNQSSPKPLPPTANVTIAGNNFSPADIDHLVTTAQEPPTEFQNEVQAELNRLQQVRASKT